MTYALAAELQKAIYQTLRNDATLQQQIGDAIYDVVPAGQPPATYVSLGPEDVRDWSDKTGRGARHDFTISVVTDAAGFQTAKAVAGAVADALSETQAALAHGTLVSLIVSARPRPSGRGRATCAVSTSASAPLWPPIERTSERRDRTWLPRKARTFSSSSTSAARATSRRWRGCARPASASTQNPWT